MYYEMYDWNTDTGEKDYALINLDHVIQMNLNAHEYQQRDEKTGRVTTWYRLKIYYTGKDNEWTYYYKSESERRLAYDMLKSAIKENALFIENKVIEKKEQEIITNVLNDNFNPLDDLLRNPPKIEPLEVKY